MGNDWAFAFMVVGIVWCVAWWLVTLTRQY